MHIKVTNGLNMNSIIDIIYYKVFCVFISYGPYTQYLSDKCIWTIGLLFWLKKLLPNQIIIYKYRQCIGNCNNKILVMKVLLKNQIYIIAHRSS